MRAIQSCEGRCVDVVTAALERIELVEGYGVGDRELLGLGLALEAGLRAAS